LGFDTELAIENLTTLYDEARTAGFTVTPITVMPGNNPATLPKIQAINAFIAAYCAANGMSYVDAFALVGDNGASSTKIATANDDAPSGSLHVNQTGHNLIGAAVAALIV
jgi:hypothetical protein